MVFARCDVTKRADPEDLVVQSEKKWGDMPDVYVAGAGVFEPDWSNFWHDSEDDGYKQVDINVNHPIKLTRIAIQSLVKHKKKGVILVVASLAGYQGVFASPLYCATKHALVHTPLWTDHPEKMKQYGYSPENAVMPEEVAAGMTELVTSAEHGGGSCLGITVGEKRTLGVWNVAPTAAVVAGASVLDDSYKPVLEKLLSIR